MGKVQVDDEFAALGSNPAHVMRIKTGIPQLDDFLGGGPARGLCTVIYGKSSSGKTTLSMEMALSCPDTVQWATAEEQVAFVDTRAHRLGLVGKSRNVFRHTTMDIDFVEWRANQIKPSMIVLDSWQKFATQSIDKDAGSNRQMVYVYNVVDRMMKKHNAAVILIAQATEEGQIDGQHRLVHNVDATVIRLSHRKDTSIRILRVDKSRLCKDGKLKMMMDKDGRLIPLRSDDDDDGDDDDKDLRPPPPPANEGEGERKKSRKSTKKSRSSGPNLRVVK